MESITLKSAPRAHSSGSLRILPYSTFGEDSLLNSPKHSNRLRYVASTAKVVRIIYAKIAKWPVKHWVTIKLSAYWRNERRQGSKLLG